MPRASRPVAMPRRLVTPAACSWPPRAARSQLGDDERHPVRHQAADEVHVAGQPIESFATPTAAFARFAVLPRRGRRRSLDHLIRP